MIDYIVGVIQEIGEQVIIETASIGIGIQMPNSHILEKGKHAKLYTYVHWNSEQGPSLYGFISAVERSVFRIIISCSGIGPKIALAILSDLGAVPFLKAIQMGDEHALAKVSGIGKKKAEQMAVTLKHKVASLLESGDMTIESDPGLLHIHDVMQALQSLNYSRTEINHAMDYVRKNSKAPEVTFDSLLRQALSYLAKSF